MPSSIATFCRDNDFGHVNIGVGKVLMQRACIFPNPEDSNKYKFLAWSYEKQTDPNSIVNIHTSSGDILGDTHYNPEMDTSSLQLKKSSAQSGLQSSMESKSPIWAGGNAHYSAHEYKKSWILKKDQNIITSEAKCMLLVDIEEVKGKSWLSNKEWFDNLRSY